MPDQNLFQTITGVACFLLIHSCAFLETPASEENIRFAKQENIDRLTTSCWNKRLDNQDLAFIQAKEALEASEEIDYALGKGQSCKCLGSIYYYQGDYALADSLLQVALNLFEKENDDLLVSYTYLQMGNVKKKKEGKEAGLEWYLKGLRHAEEKNLAEMQASFNITIAGIQESLGKEEEADRLYRATIQWQEDNKDTPHQIANSYYQYGTFLARTQSLDAALVQLLRAKELFRDLEGHKKNYATVLNSLATLQVRLGDANAAESYFSECLAIKDQIGPGEFASLGSEYVNLGYWHLRRKDFPRSTSFFQQSLAIAEETRDHQLIAKSFRGLTYINQTKKEWKEAYLHLKKSYSHRDSAFNIKEATSTNDLMNKYKNESISKAAAEVKAEANRLKFRQTLLLSFIGLLFSFIYFFSQRARHQQVELERENEIKANNAHADGQEAERKRIADSLHDSMGTKLAAVKMNLEKYSLVAPKVTEKSNVFMQKISHMLDDAITYNQNLAYQLIPPTLSKFGLPAALLSLKDRMESPYLSISVSIYGMEERLPEKLELSLYRTAEELLKNIIRHADASEVNIQLTEYEGGSFNFIVEDNGNGFDYQSHNPTFGIGLSNIKSRVEHFGGTFDVDSTPGAGTTIILDIPIKNHEIVLV